MTLDLSALSPYQWILGIASGLVIGAVKTGLNGLTLFFVPSWKSPSAAALPRASF